MKRLLVLLAVSLVFVACATVRGGSGSDGNGGAETPDPEDRVAAYESFDPASYEEAPPSVEVDIEHQVPDRLMQVQATQGVSRTVEGFRIQIYSTQEKRAAEEMLRTTTSWWERAKDDAPAPLKDGDLAAVIEYRQPYYRVRVGAFASRQQAERVLDFVKEEYPDAFITRGRVTVTE